MLLKKNITQIEMGSNEWAAERLGKFTASKINLLMDEKDIGKGGLSYIRSRLGEELSGVSSDSGIETDAMRHGLKYEVNALQEFQKLKNIPPHLIRTQKLIRDAETRFSCTPDGIWIKSINEADTAYEVSTIETKCYGYEKHIECCECSTPAEIKKVDKAGYWQTIDQMLQCDALFGYLSYYHPLFDIGGFRVIEFRQSLLTTELKLLKQRKEQALNIFNEKRELLMNIKN